ncbi:MAG TPA: SRPBCC family protein [Solirubrobacteraceae bacterium]|nr:SRPBCC family protein [Solirubrobacteraceae bacterium]
MRVQAAVDVAAPPELVWRFVDEPARYLHFMSGITRWEVVSDQVSGCGARYRTLMRVGSAEVGGLIEIVEHDEPYDLAWTSVTGIDQRGRWRLRERPGARTRVELRLQYGVAGSGVVGWIAEQIAAPTVRENLRRSLLELRRQAEHEQARAAAAARRAAAAAAAAARG